MLVLQKIRVSIKFFQENKARELNRQVNTDRSFSLGYTLHSDVMRYHKFTDRGRAPSCCDRIRRLRLQDFQGHNAVCVEASLGLGLDRHLMYQLLYHFISDMLYLYVVGSISKVSALKPIF